MTLIINEDTAAVAAVTILLTIELLDVCGDGKVADRIFGPVRRPCVLFWKSVCSVRLGVYTPRTGKPVTTGLAGATNGPSADFGPMSFAAG